MHEWWPNEEIMIEHDARTTHKKEQFILHFENSRYNDNMTKPQGKNLMLKTIAC